MTAPQNLGHLARYDRDTFGPVRLSVERPEEFLSRVIPDERKGNDDRLPRYLRLPERGHPFLKNSDDGEMQLANPNVLPERVVNRKNNRGEILREQADRTAESHVVGVELTPATNIQVADGLKPFGDTDEIDRMLLTADGHGHLHIVRSGHLGNLADALPHRLEIAHGNFVGHRPASGNPQTNGLRIDQIRPHSLDLADDVLFTCECHRHNQDYARTADHYSEHRQNRPHRIRAQRVPRKFPCLGLEHSGSHEATIPNPAS